MPRVPMLTNQSLMAFEMLQRAMYAQDRRYMRCARAYVVDFRYNNESERVTIIRADFKQTSYFLLLFAAIGRPLIFGAASHSFFQAS